MALVLAGRGDPAPLPPKFLQAADLVVLETSMGRIKIKLYPRQAPASVANFLRYVDERFYDDTLIHRVVPGFVIQGGGHDSTMQLKKTGTPVKNEAANGLSNKRGTIACARAPAPDSATSQFYINLKDNAFLNRDKAADKIGYCVFGEVVEGMDVVDRIAGVRTGSKGVHQNVPEQNVVIKSVRRGGK
jgi:cyclophilin family peptidyl-prolyl cis-trans isomerase